MRGEYQTRQKREMTRFLAEHAMQSFTPEELARGMEAEGTRVGLTRYQYHGGDDDCGRHFHVMCSRCGNMFHVDCEMAGQLAEHLFAEHGFRVDPRACVLVGLCKDCQTGGDGHGADGA